MKIVCKTLISLFLAVILSSCNGGVAAVPTMSQVNIMGTAMSLAKTEVVMTKTAVPTIAPIMPTTIPPTSTSIPPDTYAARIDYVKDIAPKIYSLLPYINQASPIGEYSGCTETNDFHNYVVYRIVLPVEVVNTAFLYYFSTEKWEFTEAISELVGYDNNILTITYDVYRIASKGLPAFERLRVVLTDVPSIHEENLVDVRAELTHIETKENIRYISNFYCPSGASWHLFSLYDE